MAPREVAWGPSGFAIAEMVFVQAQVLYPFILLLSFGVIFAVHSVYASQHQEDVEQPTVTGPGGKPLPVTRIKVEKSRAPSAAVQDFSRTASLCFKAGTATIALIFAVHGFHIIRQCIQAGWLDTERFCTDELVVSSCPKSMDYCESVNKLILCYYRCTSWAAHSIGVTSDSP